MLADGAFQPDQATHTGPMMQEIMLDPTSDTQHYPFWVVPTRMMNDFVSIQAARFILPLDDIFQEATSKAAERYSSSSLNPVRQILAFYTAQLFCRLLIYALSDEDEEQHFDNWIWKSVWSVRPHGRERSVSERRGLGLGSQIDSTGMLWIPQSHIDWQRGHLSLEVLIHLYMTRSPLQARLAHQPNVQALTATHVVVERLFQEWLRDAQLSHDTNCPEKANEYANRAIVLAVEETARAYYQHFLAKLASYWDRVRDQVGRQSLPTLSCLQRARDDSAADTASILSAQTIRTIYCEAWVEYSRATSASGHLLEQGTECNMPDELPCWMATRQRLPPKDSWSDFVHGVLFYHPNAQPKWSQLYFLQLYRSFREQWDSVKVWAGQFDRQFGVRIGHYIRVMFNTDRTKEVGTTRGEGTWYHGRPPFFQIQFWAPYFSPPQSQKGIPLSFVYHRRQYSDGLSPSTTSTIPTARDFQALDELVWEHRVQIVDNIDSLRSASHSYIRRHCRPALLYVTSLSGPTWCSNGDVKFIQPWSVERKGIDDYREEDVFRIPVVYNHIPKHMSESIINQPTIFLPNRDNVMGLLKNIESLPGHSASFIARLSWVMRELDYNGDQYDVRSHLVAKQQAIGPTARSQTLLEQFLRQTEPPERKILSPDAVDVLVISEGEEEGEEKAADDEGISRSLPPLPTVFAGRDEACDPRASFPQWQSFLSDRPAEPLSLHKTQASLHHGSVTVARQWDVDSIWFGAKSLSAIRAPNHFRLSFFPAYRSNISTAQVIQPHGLDLAHTRHTSLGSFTTAGVRFSVLLFFPNGARSHTKASANSLSLARFKDLYDSIILPAIFETVPDHVRQEIPSSYDLLYAKSRAYQEKPGAGRWTAEDESRAFRLSYSIPARNLADFWASVVEKANMHSVQTRRGDTVPYFRNPRLLFQAHDLKNTFASQTLEGSLALFRDGVLAGLDANQIDMHSCWLDVGMRDHVRQPSSPLPNHHGEEPWTLLWKSACCEHLHDQLGGIVPEASLVADQYRSYLLRDAGTYYAKAKASRASNPGHPEARSPGIIRAKAYNCSKDLFGVMFSDYQLFSSGLLPLLAFNEAMLKDLAATDQNRQRAFVSQLNRSHLVDAWEANKRHMRAVATLKRYPNFGIRKEVTFRLDVILAMWADGMLDPDQNPHTGPVSWNVPFTSAVSDQHCPFWVLPTETVVKFVSTQAARFLLPLDHIFLQASNEVAKPLSSSSSSSSSSSLDPVQQILGLYTAQLLCRLLIHSVDDEQEYGFDNWIWRPTWTVRTRGRGQRSLKQRRGLGLGDTIDTSGTLWIPDGHFNWQRGHIALEVLIGLYISRNPLQAKLARQSNVQALTANQVTIELRFQQLTSNARIEYDQGHREDAERLAGRAITLATQEIARAYHQHFLAKLHSYWDRTRGQVGRQKLPVLDLLKEAQDDSAAETSRIPTAQTIHGIYAEAWAKYCQVMTDDVDENDRSDFNMSSSSSLQSALPVELPCWMTTRRRLPPKNSWSDFLFQQIFCRPKPPTWNALFFLQLYRRFKEVWEKTCASLGPFDGCFSRQIGYYIQVAFNCDHSKEVGTSHGRTTWHHDKPPFFQIQYWAPYFSPPRAEENTPLSSVYRRREYPEGLSPCSTPIILTSREFGGIERAIWPHWVEIMHGVDSLRSSDRKKIQRHCRRALLYASYIAGPIWGRDDDVNFIQPWSLNQPSRTGGGIDEHIFRVPVAETHISRQILEETVSQPTIILPTRDNIIGLLDTMETLPGHSSTFLARLRWTRRRLNNQGDQYDIRSHLDARQEEIETTAQDQSLLDQFLQQSEPPEWTIEPADTPYSVLIEEEDGSEESIEDDGISLDSYDSTTDRYTMALQRSTQPDLLPENKEVRHSIAPLSETQRAGCKTWLQEMNFLRPGEEEDEEVWAKIKSNWIEYLSATSPTPEVALAPNRKGCAVHGRRRG
ncbi:hypothetical protein FMUND_11688 [Fusarium mundagurra]|uniref:Uncharacterized protein n=1 Tax=Fusarium mundagurra TaxID=1567541 RepID=A0A8H5Y7V3_9HYPO|nr:hypothetical protein FMUND_11688 [Fusarium mundagurra]